MVGSPRFNGFTSVGATSLGPSSSLAVIGSFPLVAGADTLWVRVTQDSPTTNNNFSYGILSWRSADGRTLGSCKCYGRPEGEVYKLSVGLSPLIREGSIIFEPRLYNLKWLREGGPAWSLSFEAHSGATESGGGGDPIAAVSGSIFNIDGCPVEFIQTDGDSVTLLFNDC